MKFQGFKVHSETVESVNSIINLKRPKIKKGTYYREAVEEKVERDKKKLQLLAVEMNRNFPKSKKGKLKKEFEKLVNKN